MSGWKTVVVDGNCNLSYSENCLLIERTETTEIPIEQVKILLIESLQVRISSRLLCELNKNRIKVIFCDERHNPYAEMEAYHNYHAKHERICQQIQWSETVCDTVWMWIVRQKIKQQMNLLDFLKLSISELMEEYRIAIVPGDITNREGQAARLYFNKLFGTSFVRGEVSSINDALNYGYSILLSMVNRKVACSGYLTELGIHHKNESNPYNFSCDLMEPFRPYVDEIAYKNRDKELDKDYRKMLVESFYRPIYYGGKCMQIHTAIEQYCLDVFQRLQCRRII